MTRRVPTTARLMVAGLLLGLAACAHRGNGDDGGDRRSLPPFSGAEWCARHASAVNPLAAAPGPGAPAPSPPQARMPGGLGGTGSPLQARSGEGAGGTGNGGNGGIGGTGIVGVVTGFASLCINGVKVEVSLETPVQRDGSALPIGALAVGQVVAVQTQGDGDWLQARHIAVLDSLVGPLERVDAVSGAFEVMGQSATALAPADLAGLRAGDWVRVSGHRLVDGHLRATLVQRTDARVARVTGVVDRFEGGGLRVGGTPVALAAELAPAGVQPGQEVSLSGDWQDGRLRATAVQLHPTRQALGGVRHVLLQGYVHRVQGQDVSLGVESFTLGDTLQWTGGGPGTLQAGQAVLVRASLDAQQRLVGERIDFSHPPGLRRGADAKGDSPGLGVDAPPAGRPGTQAPGPGGKGEGASSGRSGKPVGGQGAGGQGAGASGQGRHRGRGAP